MPTQIRVTRECDALGNPHPEGEQLERVPRGYILLLLQEFDSSYWSVALGGRPVFVPKASTMRVEDDDVREYSVPRQQQKST